MLKRPEERGEAGAPLALPMAGPQGNPPVPGTSRADRVATHLLAALAAGLVVAACLSYHQMLHQWENHWLLCATAALLACASGVLWMRDRRSLGGLLNTIDTPIAVFDKNLVLRQYNNRFTQLWFHDPEKLALRGRPLKELLHIYYDMMGAVDVHREDIKTVLSKLEAGECGEAGVRHTLALPVGGNIAITWRRQVDGAWVVTATDISGELRAAANARMDAARYDPLTGLLNRVAFRRALERNLADAKRQDKWLGVAVVKLPTIKDMNATFGARVGDDILCHVANALTSAKAADDVIGRIGSNSFAMSIAGETQLTAIEQRVTRALATIREPKAYMHDFKVDVFVGMTIYPQDGGDAEDMLQSAEIAVNRAIIDDSQRPLIYDPMMEDDHKARISIVEEIRSNLESHNFLFHYQPQIDLRTKSIRGVEALLRWKHPRRGWLAPDSFIPAAELSRLIIPLTERMFPEVCAQIAMWDARGLPRFPVAINLSPIHIRRPDLVSVVAKALADYGLTADRLEFEITESIMITENDDAQRNLRRLRELGSAVAIDDFGTGYASIAYLRRMPVNKIKIDRSFIKEVEKDPGVRAIVRAVAALGHSFQVTVVAEGIERQEQADHLLALGCDAGQGYYFSRPMPGDEMAAWTEQQYRRFPNTSSRSA